MREDKSVTRALRNSKAVFSGEIIEVIGDPYSAHEARFTVTKTWKGVKSNQIVVVSDGHPESPNYRRGEKWLVFAEERQGKLFTGICSRSKLLKDAEADLAQLGSGTTP